MARKNGKFNETPLTPGEKKIMKTFLTKELRDKLTPEEKEKLKQDFLKVMNASGKPVRMVFPLAGVKEKRR